MRTIGRAKRGMDPLKVTFRSGSGLPGGNDDGVGARVPAWPSDFALSSPSHQKNLISDRLQRCTKIVDFRENRGGPAFRDTAGVTTSEKWRQRRAHVYSWAVIWGFHFSDLAWEAPGRLSARKRSTSSVPYHTCHIIFLNHLLLWGNASSYVRRHLGSSPNSSRWWRSAHCNIVLRVVRAVSQLQSRP